MTDNVTIAVDAMGGDNAPEVVLEGVAAALAADEGLTVVLCGPADVVEPFAAQHARCRAQVAAEVIEMAEHPAQAVRKKKDSSIVVGCRLVKEGQAQGFFSAGSTGACLAAATLVMGRIKGISRPCLATVVPSPVRPIVLCDVGANADCKPEYLVQFAQMGSVYAQKILGYESPKAALLNIGEEDTKGNALAQEAHQLMAKRLTNFAGNCEGRDVLGAQYEVVVTDGFTGNIFLKTVEGAASLFSHALKDMLLGSTKNKLAALLLKNSIGAFKKRFAANEVGGTALLGISQPVIKAHGSSNAYAFFNAIRQAQVVAQADIVGDIAANVAHMRLEPGEKEG